jgi:hypothetical protein
MRISIALPSSTAKKNRLLHFSVAIKANGNEFNFYELLAKKAFSKAASRIERSVF